MQHYVFVDDGSPEAADDASNYVYYESRDPEARFAAQLEAIRRVRERRGESAKVPEGSASRAPRLRPLVRRVVRLLSPAT